MNELVFLLLTVCSPDTCLVFNNEFGLNVITHNREAIEQKHTIMGQDVWVWHYTQDRYVPAGYYGS